MPSPPLYRPRRRAQTECYKSGGTLAECRSVAVKESQGCEALRQAVFACRRGQLDNRNRIRGEQGSQGQRL